MSEAAATSCKLCKAAGTPHMAPWSPCYDKLTSESLSYSRRSGVDTSRGDYQTWRDSEQPWREDPAFVALLGDLGGNLWQNLQAPHHYEPDDQAVCPRCGRACLTISVQRGETLTQLDFCECRFDEAELRRRRAIDDRAQALLDRLEQREKQNKTAAQVAVTLRLEATRCRLVMLGDHGGCTDKKQARPECQHCTELRSTKRATWSDKRKGQPNNAAQRA